MKSTILAVTMAVLMIVAAPVFAQMMGPGPHMMQQQQGSPQQQYNPYPMHHGMMGGYGYGMGPFMMGGYGMMPHMMGGYGYGMMPHHMMGGHGFGMGHHMMGGFGMSPPCTTWQGPFFKSGEEYQQFMENTKEQRRKLHNMMFDYGEAMRSPEPDRQKLRHRLANPDFR